MAFEASVRLEKSRSSLLVHRRPALAPHSRPDERKVLDRPDERAPFEQLALLPEQAVELGGVVRAESAPEHELLRRRDTRDRVDLEEPELSHGVEHALGAPVEHLRA